MSKKKALIKKVYAEVPKVRCKGLCQSECSIIGFTSVERRMMTEAGGKAPALTEDGCNYLSNGRCSIYHARPLICRLYGAATDLVCPHGCVPDKWLTPEQASELLATVGLIGGEQEFNMDISQIQEIIHAKLELFIEEVCNAKTGDVENSSSESSLTQILRRGLERLSR